MALDLHSHTNRSDGAHDPADLVEYAAGRGVDVLAITDHDTMAGVADAQAAGRAIGVHVVPGIELSIKVPHGSMHLLGYFDEPAPEPLAGLIAGFGDIRVERAREMVDRLNGMGVDLDWDDVLDGAAGAPLGRPHIAEALIRAGHVQERKEAFDLYLGDGRPAYVGSDGLGVEEGVSLVRESGGVPVLAHPVVAVSSCWRTRAPSGSMLPISIRSWGVSHGSGSRESRCTAPSTPPTSSPSTGRLRASTT
jgi:predicted metal-dependent phosphoesterase TrpH